MRYNYIGPHSKVICYTPVWLFWFSVLVYVVAVFGCAFGLTTAKFVPYNLELTMLKSLPPGRLGSSVTCLDIIYQIPVSSYLDKLSSMIYLDVDYYSIVYNSTGNYKQSWYMLIVLEEITEAMQNTLIKLVSSVLHSSWFIIRSIFKKKRVHVFCHWMWIKLTEESYVVLLYI